jgi:serine/threonine-protein kinase
VRSTGEAVAVKLLRPDLADDPVLVARFLNEAQLLRALRHPHLVGLRDVVLEGGRLGLVVDLVEGGDLRQRLREAGRLPPAEAAGMLAGVAEALGAVHAAGITHRDVKPANVLLGADGTPRLADLGVARLATAAELTHHSGTVGTPDYLSPEGAEGQAGPPSDVYALGVVLHEVLAGTVPFPASHPLAVLRLHALQPPPVLPVPAPLADLLAELLAKDPSARPTSQDAATRLRALEVELAGVPALTAGPPPSAAPDSSTTHLRLARAAPAPVVQTPRRRARLIAAAVAALLLVTAAGTALALRGDPPAERATAAGTPPPAAGTTPAATPSPPPVATPGGAPPVAPSVAPAPAAVAGAAPGGTAPGNGRTVPEPAAPAAPAPPAPAPAPAVPAPAAPAPRQPAGIPGSAPEVSDRRCSGAARTVVGPATIETVSCIGYVTRSSDGKRLVQADTYAREVPGSAHNAYGRFRVWVQIRRGDGSFLAEQICDVTSEFDAPASDGYWARCGRAADTSPAGLYSVGFARSESPAAQTDPGRLSQSPAL